MRNKIVLFIFLTLTVFFMLLMFAQSQGYYKNRNEKAKILTEKQINEFEKDIAKGKNVDIKKYVLYEDKDYTNKVSNNIYKTSLQVEKVVDKTIKLIFNRASNMVE